MKPTPQSHSRKDLFWRPLLGLLFFLLNCPVVSAEINLPFTSKIKAPPQALPITVNAHKGDPVQISLRCSGDVNLSPKFRIRAQPHFGSLTEPRLTTRDSALVIYSPSADSPTGEDKFSYSVQGSAGVSLPQEVLIRFYDDPPLLIVAEQVNFGKVLLGESAIKSFQIENRGGGVIEGTLGVKGDFKIKGDPSYRLAGRESKTVEVIFTPSFVGSTAGTVNYGSHPDRETAVAGEGLGPIVASPSMVKLVADPKDGTRSGQLAILNRTAQTQKVAIRGDLRLKVASELELPPGATVPLAIEVEKGNPEAFIGSVEITVNGFSEKKQVQAPALGPIFQVSSPQVQFGQVVISQPAMKGIIVENIGGSRGEVVASVDLPFTLKPEQASFVVEPGTKTEVQIGLEAHGEGIKIAKLRLNTESGDFQIPIEADVVNGLSQVPDTISALPARPVSESAQSDAAPKPYLQRKPIQIESLGFSQCQLSWEAVSATAYTLETRWLYVDDKGDIQWTWEALDNTEITQQGNRMVAKVSKLSPEFPYTVRAAAIGPTGAIIERTGEANFITSPKPPLITPMRFLLGCLAFLLVIAAKRWWNDRE